MRTGDQLQRLSTRKGAIWMVAPGLLLDCGLYDRALPSIQTVSTRLNCGSLHWAARMSRARMSSEAVPGVSRLIRSSQCGRTLDQRAHRQHQVRQRHLFSPAPTRGRHQGYRLDAFMEDPKKARVRGSLLSMALLSRSGSLFGVFVWRQRHWSSTSRHGRSCPVASSKVKEAGTPEWKWPWRSCWRSADLTIAYPCFQTLAPYAARLIEWRSNSSTSDSSLPTFC